MHITYSFKCAFLFLQHTPVGEIKSSVYILWILCSGCVWIQALSVNPFILCVIRLPTIPIFHNDWVKNHWIKNIWEERQYRPVGRPLWPKAESWVHKVPGWQLDWWRWHGHTAAPSLGPGLVFLRWHRNSWLVWGGVKSRVFRKTKYSRQLHVIHWDVLHNVW